ncbi:MAG: MMPL family transporter [Geodermatophilaceae bacterium]|nr:MMPL family transporter [Geodermatophilaceae bacterium]
MLAGLGRAIARRPLLVVVVWLLLAALGFTAALGGFGEGLFPRLTSGDPSVPGEARDGQEILLDNAETGGGLTLLVDGVQVTDPGLVGPISSAREELAVLDGVLRVLDPLGAPGGPGGPAATGLVAEGGDGLLVVVDLKPDLSEADNDAALTSVQALLDGAAAEITESVEGARALVGGTRPLITAITDQVSADLATGEGIALPVSLLVLILVFGGFLAAGMPILGAIASIAVSLLGLLGFSYLIDLDASVVNVVTVLGLGLCIDYGLLIVSRFREELRKPAQRVGTALAETMATAGRTVVFSAITVGISLSGLLLFTADFLRAVGAAGISIVLVALLVALTLIPALLALAGPRMVQPGTLHRIPGFRTVLRRFGDISPPDGVFSRLGRATQRRPLLVVLGVLAVLVLLAAPVVNLQLRNSGVTLLPESAPQRQFFDTLTAEYPAAGFPAVQIVGRASPAQMSALAEQVTAMDSSLTVAPPTEVGPDYSVLNVFTADGDAAGPAAQALVEAVRADRPDYQTWVTGQSAGLIDFVDSIKDRAPLAAAVVVLATLVLLFLMTGSILVPLKALLMNVVSLGASFGVLVWVFQYGNLSDVLGFTPTGGIETTIPLLVLAFGFGLAMDYEVFLLSRIKEFRDGGMSNNDAVVAGLQRSGRIITSAGLIVVLVFAGFVVGQLIIIKQTGVALAVAVAIDATLIRCLLVPATMTLLGEWNWWAPRPLRRLYARFGVREV